MSGGWQNRSVLITGHTGFKGSWLAHWLLLRGAQVHGFALPPDRSPALFDQLNLANRLHHTLGDIRDEQVVRKAVESAKPAVIFHLAAQPLVRRSYDEPVYTFAANVLGTAHVLEAVRQAGRPVAVVVVTTDKVYENREWVHGYRETDRLGGHDPYSASKAACELVADSYRKSYFSSGPIRVATARAGNVIGGGDWAADRIVPDLIRATSSRTPLEVRNPASVRPWQHVLDPLAGYITLAERLLQNLAGGAEAAFNFGPDAADQRRVQELVEEANKHWPLTWHTAQDSNAPHEAGLLTLTTQKAAAELGWHPRWPFSDSVKHTIEWYSKVAQGADAAEVTTQQIAAFEARCVS